MGIPIQGMKDIELFLSEFNATYRQDISPDLVISGRDQILEKLHSWFAGQSAEITLEGESVAEVEAFVSAAVMKLPEEKKAWISSRLIFADQPEAIDYISGTPCTNFVVTHTPEVSRRAKARRCSGMRLIVPTTRFAGNAAQRGSGLRLGRRIGNRNRRQE